MQQILLPKKTKIVVLWLRFLSYLLIIGSLILAFYTIFYGNTDDQWNLLYAGLLFVIGIIQLFLATILSKLKKWAWFLVVVISLFIAILLFFWAWLFKIIFSGGLTPLIIHIIPFGK